MNNFIKAIMAGISIAIASSIYLKIGGTVGAILFSIGLLLVLTMNFKLYTGTIGYIHLTKESIVDNIIILCGNVLGSMILLPFPQASAITLVTAKLATPFYLLFIKSFICGILIYIAVVCYHKNLVYMVPVCVTAFILFGAEHCIADMCYIVSTRIFTWQSFFFILTVILGNSIGAILFHQFDTK